MNTERETRLYDMSQYKHRLSEALCELSVILSNAKHGWVQQAAAKGYNAILSSIPIEEQNKMLQLE